MIAQVTNDPAWFYSSLAQVTAAIVGFLGGFLIIRLTSLMSEWRTLMSRLETSQRAWVSVNQTIKRIRPTHPIDIEADRERLWYEVMGAVGEQNTARLPREMAVWGIALGILAASGIVWPLIALGAPTNSLQVDFLVPWAVVLLAFVGLMYRRAVDALRELKSVPLWSPVRSKYDEEIEYTESEAPYTD
jgi:hypothetical protein